MLFTLTYRQNLVQTTVIEASSLPRAMKVAEVWCAKQPACRLVNLKPLVSADESLVSADEWAEFERLARVRAAKDAAPPAPEKRKAL